MANMGNEMLNKEKSLMLQGNFIIIANIILTL